jgi:hypothetical protein
MRPISQAADSVQQIPHHPDMHRLPRHPGRRGDLADLRPRQHRTHRVQPLLDLGQHHQSHSRPSLSDGTTNRPSGWARHDPALSIN